MKSRLVRMLLGGTLVLGIPMSALAVEAGVAGAATANHMKATFTFKNPHASSFVGKSTCAKVAITTPTNPRPTTSGQMGLFNTTCTTTSSGGGGGIPTTSTTTLSSPANGLHYFFTAATHAKTRVHLSTAVIFTDTFGTSGKCTIHFTSTGLTLSVTTVTYTKASISGAHTTGHVTVSGTGGAICTAIGSLLNTITAKFTATFKFTLEL